MVFQSALKTERASVRNYFESITNGSKSITNGSKSITNRSPRFAATFVGDVVIVKM